MIKDKGHLDHIICFCETATKDLQCIMLRVASVPAHCSVKIWISIAKSILTWR